MPVGGQRSRAVEAGTHEEATMSWIGEFNVGLGGFLCALVAGLVLFAARAEGEGAQTPQRSETSGEEVSQEALRSALAELKAKVEKAQAAKLPTLYAEVPFTVGTKFVEQDWENRRVGRRRADWVAFLLRQIRYESTMLDDLLGGKPDPRPVPPLPAYARLEKQGSYLCLDGKPMLLVTTRYPRAVNDETASSEAARARARGQVDYRYAGRGELWGFVSSVGAHRYDFQTTPIWELYQKDPKSHRVFDGGWCGHIIKDRWSIGGFGGTETECIISLDYPPMLEAVRKSILMKAEEFKKDRHYNDYKMLALQWELTYQNYDEASLRKWQEWLRCRYGTIEELNSIWKTDLTDFSEVTLPPVQWNAEENPAKFYDFGEFNLWRFTDYLLWARTVITEQLPGWYTTTGGGQPFGSGFAHDAVDEEYLRVNGVVDVFLSETGSRSWGTAVFMDLQHSIDPNTMIQDPEYHAAGGLMPLMFFHGAAVIDFYDWVGAGVNALLPHGYATLRGTLDARRLAEYIVQFPKAVPQAALLYSRASLIQRFPGTTGRQGADTPYTLELQKCYRAGTLLDTPIGFITTRQVTMGIGEGIKVIIVPGAYFAGADEVAKVLSFAEAGGTVVVMPTSFVADEYNRRRHYLDAVGIEIVKEEEPRNLAAKARAGVSMPGSEYDFIQGPIAETVVSDEPTAALTWTAKGPKAADTLAGRGIRQTVKVTGDHQVLATYEDGSPAVLAKPHGRGQVIYVAMQLEQDSIGDLLDWVYDRAGVERLVRAQTPTGEPVPGLESRTVRYGDGYLTYLYNLSEQTVTAKLRPAVKVTSIQDLTYARTLEPSATFEVGPYDFYILKLLP
jgi:hypothetical protein